jgi:type IV pilus assembly protein PilC
MALFWYKAMNSRGRLVRGEMDAINQVDLEMRLKRMDLDFINGAPVKRAALFHGASVPRRELINFCFHLEQLTRSGVPILEGLTDLRDSLSHPHFREIIASMIESIEGGRTLSQAMGEHPKVFNTVFCNLVRAGEATGNVPEVLKSLNESLKWEDELASQTKRLFMYPAFVGTIVIAVTVFLLVYLVPQMASFIKNMGQALPLQTRLLIATSDAFRQFWYLFVGLPVAAVIALNVAIRVNPAARLRFDDLKLRLPVIGPILRKIILSRFAGIFAMMYASGIPIIDAVRTTETIVGNVVIEDGLKRAGQMIAEGQNVTTAFHNLGMFPPLVIRMLRVGENTGALDTALLNVSYFYNRDVKESIDKIQAGIEPAMTLLLGAILGWVMLSVLGPVYDVITKLKV